MTKLSMIGPVYSIPGDKKQMVELVITFRPDLIQNY